MKIFSRLTTGTFLTLYSVYFIIGTEALASNNKPPRVQGLEGKVQMRNVQTADWKEAKTGVLLAEGDEILTGSDGRCRIGFYHGQKSMVRLEPDTHAVLRSFIPVKLEMKSGKLFSLVQKLKQGSHFEVATPTAIAAVRGTGWEQSLNRIGVFEGAVRVTGQKGDERDVSKGQALEIGEDGSLGQVFELSKDERKEWKRFRNEALQVREPVTKDDFYVGNDPFEDLMEAKGDVKDVQTQKDLKKEIKDKEGGKR